METFSCKNQNILLHGETPKAKKAIKYVIFYPVFQLAHVSRTVVSTIKLNIDLRQISEVFREFLDGPLGVYSGYVS